MTGFNNRIKPIFCLLLRVFFCSITLFSSVCYAVTVEDILLPIPVSKSNISTWSTPIDYREGKIFVVTVERPKGILTGINLKTVIRQGQKVNRKWVWKSYVIDSETIDDQWHNIPSLALDPTGYIHIAYNMHNMPWQYVVSKRPLQIAGFDFKGDYVGTIEKQLLKYFNKTPFPGIGKALIPGNQVTYPAFFKDKNNDIYITYRYAARPKKPFKNRGFGAGIAKYNSRLRQWTSIGGDFQVTGNDAVLDNNRISKIQPFALSFGWWAYLPRLAFDSKNRMFVIWMWRKSGAGANHSHPSFAYSEDNGETFKKIKGGKYRLPITIDSADLIKVFPESTSFLGPTRLVIGPNDEPNLLFQTRNQGGRFLVKFDKKKMEWSKPEKMPSSALEFAYDSSGNMWAFATGLKVFRRSGKDSKWKLVFADQTAKKPDKSKIWCQPKIIPVLNKKMFLIHSQSCDYSHIKITKVNW